MRGQWVGLGCGRRPFLPSLVRSCWLWWGVDPSPILTEGSLLAVCVLLWAVPCWGGGICPVVIGAGDGEEVGPGVGSWGCGTGDWLLSFAISGPCGLLLGTLVKAPGGTRARSCFKALHGTACQQSLFPQPQEVGRVVHRTD